MLAGMSMSEYVHWQAIYETEPFPEERADLRNAELLRMMLVAAGVKKLPSFSELIPDYWGESQPRAQSPAQMKANMDLILSASKKNKKRK